jgi:hypothetical protein
LAVRVSRFPRQALVILDEMHHPDAEEVRVKVRSLDGGG